MEDLRNIVLLIDADNTQLSKIESIIREISTHGRIVVKRAYGNWKKENHKYRTMQSCRQRMRHTPSSMMEMAEKLVLEKQLCGN